MRSLVRSARTLAGGLLIFAGQLVLPEHDDYPGFRSNDELDR